MQYHLTENRKESINEKTCSIFFGNRYNGCRGGKDGPTLIVTSGIGYWGPPLRVGSDYEITVINMY